MEYSTKLCHEIGLRGFLKFILVPYYGIRFYFVDLDEVKCNGEWFLAKRTFFDLLLVF